MLFCYDLILYSIDFIVLIKFMDRQFGTPRCSYKQRNLLLVCTILLSAIFLWNSFLGGTYPFMSVILSSLFLCLYKGNIQKKMLFTSIQLAVSGYIVVFILALLSSLSINLRYIGINYYITLTVMHLIFWLPILMLAKFSNRTSVILPKNLLCVVLAIPISSIFVLAFFLVRVNNNSDTLYFLEIPLICVFIFINIITAFIYSKFCLILEKSNEVLLLKQQLDLGEQYFQNLSNAQKKIKGIRHDMKNHLHALLFMSEQKPLQIQDIKTYIQNLLSTIEDTTQIISTGNLGIDAILSLKMTQIREKKIKLDSHIIIPSGINISFDDSIIVLGNILDNAIEACEKQLAENQWIRLEITYIQHTLFIRVSNPFIIQNNKLSADGYEHGFGLKNVQTVVEKHNGIMQIKCDEMIFTIKIVLYDYEK